MATLFILGAGASADSGLPVYRGNGTDPENYLSLSSSMNTVWDYLTPLYEAIKSHTPGPTYDALKRFPDSLILTQNIDRYALSTGIKTVEIHGVHDSMSCKSCKKKVVTDLSKRKCECGGDYRPDITLYGEDLDPLKCHEVYCFIAWSKPKRVVIIGTSIQFGYLKEFIHKAKQHGAKIIHINPDPNYAENVGYNEIWHKVPAVDGMSLL